MGTPIRAIGLGLLALAFADVQTAPAPGAVELLARIGGATAVVLAGEGAGRLISTSTAVVVRPDGVLLTTYHPLKDAREVQVRLKGGEVFDHATLIGVDERRDVACLKIAASELAYLKSGTAQSVRAGEMSYGVMDSNGLTWAVTQGNFGDFRMADEIPGAGQGYRLLHFNAPHFSVAGGGPLVDRNGLLVGIVTRGSPLGPLLSRLSRSWGWLTAP